MSRRTTMPSRVERREVASPGITEVEPLLDIDDVATRPNITVGPDLLTVDEAARILRISRTTAYKEVSRYRATSGREGIPVILVGGLLRVPRVRLETLIGGPVHLPPPRPRPRDPADVVDLPATGPPSRRSAAPATR